MNNLYIFIELYLGESRHFPKIRFMKTYVTA